MNPQRNNWGSLVATVNMFFGGFAALCMLIVVIQSGGRELSSMVWLGTGLFAFFVGWGYRRGSNHARLFMLGESILLAVGILYGLTRGLITGFVDPIVLLTGAFCIYICASSAKYLLSFDVRRECGDPRVG